MEISEIRLNLKASYAVLNNKAWRKKLWPVSEVVSQIGIYTQPINFCTRDTALMWLKRYGKSTKIYNLRGEYVHVLGGVVYFYCMGACAEPRRMCIYGQRNN